MTTIKLPVVEISKSNTFSYYRYGFVVFIFIFLATLIFLEGNNNFTGKVFLVVLVIYIGIGFFIKKPAVIDNGYLFICKNYISYATKDGTTQQYSMIDINDITLVYSGYDGKTRTSSLLLLETGNNNELTFKYIGQDIYYRIHLDYKHMPLLRRVFKELEDEGKAVTIKK
jgi:hypothetical protein